MLRHVLGTRPSALALTAGALLLIVCSLTRAAGQPLVDHVPSVAVILTLLVFLVPGVLTGVIAARSFSWWRGIRGAVRALGAAFLIYILYVATMILGTVSVRAFRI